MRIVYLIKEKRKQNNMTLKNLLRKTGISKSHINDIENNLKEPSNGMLVRLAKALEVPTTELYKIVN